MAGGKVLGHFPTEGEIGGGDDAHGELNIGRGRLIPTTSWEAVWHGVAQWVGVAPSRIASVLPHASNFASGQLFTEAQLFA